MLKLYETEIDKGENTSFHIQAITTECQRWTLELSKTLYSLDRPPYVAFLTPLPYNSAGREYVRQHIQSPGDDCPAHICLLPTPTSAIRAPTSAVLKSPPHLLSLWILPVPQDPPPLCSLPIPTANSNNDLISESHCVLSSSLCLSLLGMNLPALSSLVPGVSYSSLQTQLSCLPLFLTTHTPSCRRTDLLPPWCLPPLENSVSFTLLGSKLRPFQSSALR